MKKLIYLTSIIALILCSCAKNTTTELTAEQKATIEKEVRDQFDKLVSSINQLDFDLWSENWDEDNFISHISGRRGITYGWSAWSDSVRTSFSARERHESEPLDLRVTVLTEDLVLLTQVAIWENWWKNGDYIKSNGKTTLLWKRELNGWKVIHVHESGLRLEEIIAE